MSFFAWERWTAIDCCIEVSCENMLQQPRNHYLLRCDVRKLNPIVQKRVSDPEHRFIDTLSSNFLLRVRRFFFREWQLTLSNPVVLLSSINLTEEPNRRGTACQSKFFERFLNQVDGVISKVDSGPVEHLCLLHQVWHNV